MIEPTRFYLHLRNLGFSKLCWFHERKESEMIFGFYGLSSKEAYYASQYEDRYLDKEEMRSLRINYKDAGLRQKEELANHFTLDKSGRFHLKLKSGDERFIDEVQLLTPINDKIEEFLEFFIISDLVSKYEQTTKSPKKPYVSLPVSPANFVILRGRFSGVNFDLEKTIAEEEMRLKKTKIFFPAILLKGKVFQGIFTFHIYKPKSIDFSKRPEGTYVLIALPTVYDKFLIKTFVFS